MKFRQNIYMQLALFGLLLPFSVSISTLGEKNRNGRFKILESLGRVGVFEVSRPIGKYHTNLHILRPGIYQLIGGGLKIRTHTSGLISEIQLQDSRFSTQKKLRPRKSTAKDVLDNYGSPQKSSFRDEYLVFDYDGFSFLFECEKDDQKNMEEEQLLKKIRISTITLKWTTRSATALPTEIKPQKAVARFPIYEHLPAQLKLLLDRSQLANIGGLQGSALYYRLIKESPPLRAASLLNVYTKMAKTILPSGNTVLSFLETLVDLQQDRLFAFVRKTLLDEVKQETGDNKMFHGAIAFVHPIPRGFKGYVRKGSFKTRLKKGGLQLTFFLGKGGKVLMDSDVDEKGPSFSHFLHVITLRKAHPYRIHQILVEQGLNPAYALLAQPMSWSPE